MRKIIIFYIFIAFNPYSGFAQKTRKVDVFMVYAITDSDSTTKIRFITLIPNDIENKQKINDIYFSVQPDTVFFRGNNKYAEFNLMKPIPESIEIISNITTFNNDYKTVAQGSPILDTTDLSRYLKSERWIDSEHPEILERAQKLMGKNELSTVKNIYNFVKKI
ncbi:MAG: hypothetical protein LUF90_10645 [Rikenellaceae bacterium]|nr:hypothetical protein [Rikenellaceae bacterium]